MGTGVASDLSRENEQEGHHCQAQMHAKPASSVPGEERCDPCLPHMLSDKLGRGVSGEEK